MNILAFDTCFAACSVAAGRLIEGSGDAVVARRETMATGHAERLLPMIAEVLDEAGLAIADLDRIGVTIGPGSFTGTRIGVAAARAFVVAHGIDAVGLTSLSLIAREAAALEAATAGESRPPILVAVDARRGEVYSQLFDSDGVSELSAPLLQTVGDAAITACAHAAVIVSTGADAVLSAVAEGCRPAARHTALLPDARYAVSLVSSSSLNHRCISPLYLRPPDAKPAAAAQLQRR